VKSALETLSPTRVKLTIEAPFGDLTDHFAKAYKEIAGKVTIPGFRKGKVPSHLIDQRVGRAAVLDEAINIAIPALYMEAAREHEVRVIGRPEVDITELVDNEKLAFTIEVDVRPKLDLPSLEGIKLTVDPVEVSEKDIDEQVEALRIRFGTLTTVEKTVESGDFVSIDLIARIDGKEVDGGSANNLSYEVGTDRMIPGLDAALVGLNATESKIFKSELYGTEVGQLADVEVKLNAVKHRELPPLDDSFAELASEFDTLAQLRDDVKSCLERLKSLEQGTQARDKLLEYLLENTNVPLPEKYVEAEVNAHLEPEGRLEDAAHRVEVETDVRKSLTNNFLLDSIVDAEKVDVSEAELTEFIIRSAMRYGMPPEQFAQEVAQAGQISSLVADVARTKALAVILEQCKVVDSKGKAVDLEALRPPAAIESAPAQD
jgi:trigger factor